MKPRNERAQGLAVSKPPPNPCGSLTDLTDLQRGGGVTGRLGGSLTGICNLYSSFTLSVLVIGIGARAVDIIGGTGKLGTAALERWATVARTWCV